MRRGLPQASRRLDGRGRRRRASLTRLVRRGPAGAGPVREAVAACLEPRSTRRRGRGQPRRRGPRLLHPRLGLRRARASPSSRRTRPGRWRSTRSSATSTARPRAQQPRRVRLLRRPLGRRGRAVRARPRDPPAHRQRGRGRARHLQHRRGAHRPGAARRGRGRVPRRAAGVPRAADYPYGVATAGQHLGRGRDAWRARPTTRRVPRRSARPVRGDRCRRRRAGGGRRPRGVPPRSRATRSARSRSSRRTATASPTRLAALERIRGQAHAALGDVDRRARRRSR